jgi:hypothetical protein
MHRNPKFLQTQEAETESTWQRNCLTTWRHSGAAFAKEGAMSVSAISSSLQTYQNTVLKNNLQQFQQEFQQLGSDLQSGNVSGAESDLSALQQSVPGFSGSSSGNNPISQAFNQLSQQLQSGNLTGAQQDYANLKQNFDERGAEFRHRHPANGTPSNPVGNPLLQLGESSETSSQTSALQAYGRLQQNLLPFTDASETAQSPTSGISLTA